MGKAVAGPSANPQDTHKIDHVRELADVMAAAAREYGRSTRGAHAGIEHVEVEAGTNQILITNYLGMVLAFVPDTE